MTKIIQQASRTMPIIIPDGKHSDDAFVIKNENYLMNNIEARHYTSYLFVNGVFSEDEMDSVDDTVEFQERNKLLLKILTEKGRDGFKVFKKALHKRGYLNMDMIEHKMKVRKESNMGPKHIIIDRAWREFIDSKDETKILQNRAILIRKMEASRLTSYLATKQVIDGYDMTTVDTLPKTLANKELLRIVCGRGSTAFMWFVEALRVNGFGRLSTLLFGRPITSSTIPADSGESDDSFSSSSSSTSSSSDDDEDKDKEAEDTKSQKKDNTDKEAETEDTESRKKDDEEQNHKTHDSQSQAVGDLQSYKSNGDIQLHTISEETEQLEKQDNGVTPQSDMDIDTKSNRGTEDSFKDEGQSQKSQNKNQLNNNLTETTEGNPETQNQQGIFQEEGAIHQYKDDQNIYKEREGDIQKKSGQNRDSNYTNVSLNQTNLNDEVKPPSRNNHRSGKSSKKKRSRTPRSPFKRIVSRNVTREPIDYVLAEKLRYHLRELERSLDAESVVYNLVESGLIDQLDVDTISALREPHQKVRELISLILWGGPDGFRLFLDALLETNQTMIHRLLTTQKKNSIRMNETAIPSIIVDEVGHSLDVEDDSDTQPLPTTKSTSNKQHRFRWATS